MILSHQRNLHLSGGTCAKVTKTVDSGAGFFIEEDDEDGEIAKTVTQQPGNVRKAKVSLVLFFMSDPLYFPVL